MLFGNFRNGDPARGACFISAFPGSSIPGASRGAQQFHGELTAVRADAKVGITVMAGIGGAIGVHGATATTPERKMRKKEEAAKKKEK